MGGGGDKYVVGVTPHERRRAASLVRVKEFAGGKGAGVVATRDIPAFTMIGAYPGERYTLAEYQKRVDQGHTDGKFAVDFWKPDANGTARSGYVLDPGAPDGTLLPRFAHAVAPLVNEPGERGAPSLVWVWNLPKYRMEHWTRVPVKRGQELTLCYGTGGGYDRSYRTSCVSRPGEVEPQLHVVAVPGGRPVPFSSLGSRGVRAALRALGGQPRGAPA